MIVVADTSPLNYLIRLGYAELLQILYGRVLVPTAVMNELRHTGAPSVVRDWANSPPSWLEEVVAHSLVADLPQSLGPGESEAISLALEIHADFLIVDEITADGRRPIGNSGLRERSAYCWNLRLLGTSSCRRRSLSLGVSAFAYPRGLKSR